MLMAGAGLGAAALAAEMHADYVKDLMLDESEVPAPAPEPKAPVAAPVVTPAPAVATPADELDPFDQDFDLSLDELEEASPTIVEDRTAPVLDEPTLDDDELSFESVLRQQNEAKQSPPEDLADFDLGLSEEPLSTTAEDDFLLGLENDLRDLPAFDDKPALDPAAEAKKSEDDQGLPDDFDLSLSDEIETDPTPNVFTTELDDVNAELDRLSQRMDQPPMAKPFATPPILATEDALDADDEPEFDFLEGTDEAATKLDLARAYIEMGDSDGARDILDEVVGEGDEAQKTEAREMLASLS
jgi:pilus assembly protein FimV